MTHPFQFNPLSADFAANPYATYAEMRASDAPYHWPKLDMVMLSRHADVAQIATNPAMVRSLVGYRSPAELAAEKQASGFADMPFHERFVQSNLLDTDGPDHGRLRRTVMGAFTRSSVARMEADIRSYVDQRLLDIPHGQTFDFVETVAAPLPGLVIGRFLGVPDEDAPRLRQWSEDVVSYYDVDKTPEKKARAETAVRDFHDYLVALKKSRQRVPKEDLLSQMIAQETAGAFKGDEFIATCMLILMAGHGSTIDVIGTGLHTLLIHPTSFADLRRHPAFLPNAVEEMFRYEPPLPFFHRHTTVGIEIRGRHYPAGTTFGLLYASANRDEAAISEANRFDIRRQPNRHLAFGRGAHLCLGNQLARLNMRVLFGEILARFERVESVGVATFKRGLSVRGLERLNVTLN